MTPKRKHDRERKPKQFLYVRFLRGDRIERERILELHYACHQMELWCSRGLEYRVKNHPVKQPRSGVAAVIFAGRGRVTATRFLREVA